MSPRSPVAFAPFAAVAVCLAVPPPGAALAEKARDPDVIYKAELPTDLVIVTDGSGHYVAASLAATGQVFYGDGKTFWKQQIMGSGANLSEGKFDWGLWAPQASRHAQLELRDKAWTMECSDHITPLHPLDEAATRKLFSAATFRKQLWKRYSVALARDGRGRYYFVDQMRVGEGLRLFIGKKGRLKEQKLVDTTSDSAGIFLETGAGDLQVELATSTAAWVVGDKRTPLIFLPLDANRLLIYGQLGVYRQRLGVPCDDL